MSVTATDASASEGGHDTGTFTVSRATSTSKSLVVYYKVSGTATNGTDFTALSGSVTIAGGATSAPVQVEPIEDLLVEGAESVTVTISANRAYKIGSPGSASVNIADNDTQKPPAAPSGLTAAAVSSERIDLKWTDNSGDETGFKIEQSADGANFATAATVGADVTSYSATGLQPATTYFYRVRAYNGAGDSANSETAAAATSSADAGAALYVSTSGSDANDGLTPESPLRTISTAALLAVPGTTVHIGGGVYYEQVVTKVGGVEGQEIVFKSYNGTAVIDGSTQSWTLGGNQNQGLVELHHPYVKLVGLKIINSRNTGVVLNADHLTVEGCEVAETQRHAISTHTNRQTNYPNRPNTMIRNVTLKGNLIRRATLMGQGYGQAVSLIADEFLVANNTVRDNVTEGIDVWLGAKHGEVVGNTVHGNGAVGIYVDGASYVRIHGNRVFNNPKGIGVTSEDENYSTHHVWVYNNLIYDNTNEGCFIWDDKYAPGYKGSQDVLIAHNTLVGNRLGVYLSGEGNTAEIMNNLGYSTESSVYDRSVGSTYNIHHNVWLTGAIGFVNAANKDFHLTSSSPALDKGAPSPYFYDDLGRSFTINADFDGLARVVNSYADAGAYEYR